MYELRNAFDWISAFLARPLGRGWVLVVLVSILLGLGADAVQFSRVDTLATQSHHVVQRLSHDEQTACVIQARGLPASHRLSSILHDLYVLVTLPETPAQRQRVKDALPPKEYTTYKNALTNLTGGLASYAKVETKQPKTRSCAF